MYTRRELLAAGGVALLAPRAVVGTTEAEEVTPIEDLMREHGILRRVLLIYDEGIRRIQGNVELDPAQLLHGARIVRRVIEDYHEKNEEKQVFPRFERAGKMTDLVAVLRTQHQAGRQVTTHIESLLAPSSFKDAANRHKLVDRLSEFGRMYRAHAAREDTVLFPAFKGLVSAHEYLAIGDAFEADERRLLGPDGFEKVVDEVAGIEKALGIYDLARLTPRT